MDTPLISTKLNLPPIRRDLVSRHHLIERLNAGLERKLTLISAPAGYGKTTLLSSWAEQTGRFVSWLTLEKDDNDPARFWQYFLSALAQGISPKNLEEIETTYSESSLTSQINHIAASCYLFILVLDDYQLIHSNEVHNTVEFLLEHQPINLHLAISSRADPPLRIARLRARDQLNELHLAELRFSPAEAASFLTQIMHLDLSPDNIKAIVRRTEGWVAGLQMTALALQSPPVPDEVPETRTIDLTKFIQDFTGSHRYIMDYLVEEVLQRQPLEVQKFLLKTSILDEMSGGLCESVITELNTGQGQELLESLENQNLFVMPLDDHRHWYRYHRLFADLLKKKMNQAVQNNPEGFESIAVLHQRACEWFETQEMKYQAIDHALAAEDYGHAAEMMEETAEETLMNSQFITLFEWLEALPEIQFREHPILRLYHAWGSLFGGRTLDQVEKILLSLPSDKESGFCGHIASLRSLTAVYQGKLNEAFQLADQALDELPATDRFSRSFATWITSLRDLTTRDHQSMVNSLEQFINFSQRIGNTMLTVMAVCNLAEIHLSHARLNQAEITYRRALDLTEVSESRDQIRGDNALPVSGIALIGIGEVKREMNQLPQAIQVLEEGIRRIDRWRGFGIEGLYTLALAYQACGETQAAMTAIQKAWQQALEFDATQVDDRIVALYQARLYLAQGDLENAKAWLDLNLTQRKENAGFFEDHILHHENIHEARLLIALDQSHAALELLTPLPSILEAQGRIRRLTEVFCLIALAFFTLYENENTAHAKRFSSSRETLTKSNEQEFKNYCLHAMHNLEKALSLSLEHGLVRTVLDEGEKMKELLTVFRTWIQESTSRFLESGTASEPDERLFGYTDQLLKWFSESPASIAIESQLGMVKPLTQELELSDRELEVLNLAAKGLSNQEIADHFFITVRTVKWHTGNVYSKLGVKNRTQAIAKARELGWLVD